MNLIIRLIFTLGLVGCVPVRQAIPVPGSVDPSRKPNAPPLVAKASIQPENPASPASQPQITRSEIAGVLFEGLAFDSRSHRLLVADQPGGPGSQWPDASAAVAAHHGLAAINAGFFTPEGNPLGKVVADGKAAGFWNRSSSLGSGVWLEPAHGVSVIKRRELVPGAIDARNLLQAGPMILENRQLVSGLESTKSSVRSILLWDGQTRWWIGRTSSCTLAVLGKALATASPTGWPVSHALNLDGGRSSDLAIASSVPGGPLTRRAPWNKPVRNFFIVIAR